VHLNAEVFFEKPITKNQAAAIGAEDQNNARDCGDPGYFKYHRYYIFIPPDQ
jgi:hypothetical protein